jgi:hypothetical protein
MDQLESLRELSIAQPACIKKKKNALVDLSNEEFSKF